MSDQVPAANVPAGWYPEGNGQRYWDGAAWTDHRAPVAPGAVVRTKRTRNYLGDLSLAVAILAGICVTVALYPFIGLLGSLTAIVLGITALARARGRKSLVTGILGIVAGALLPIYMLTIIAYWASTSTR